MKTSCPALLRFALVVASLPLPLFGQAAAFNPAEGAKNKTEEKGGTLSLKDNNGVPIRVGDIKIDDAKLEEKGVVRIPAGRLKDVLEFLNKRYPAAKFTATPDVLFLQVNEVQVGGANGMEPSPNDVAKAVERACDPLAVSDSGDSNHPVFNFQKNLIFAPAYNAVDAVEAFNLEDTATEGSDPDKRAKARYNQAELIKSTVIETISTVRQEGRVPVNEVPRFQFNPSANVLVAIGNPDVLGITRKIVEAVNAAARGSVADKAATDKATTLRRAIPTDGAAAAEPPKPASNPPAPNPNH